MKEKTALENEASQADSVKGKRRIEMENKKSTAKIGMVLSMGSLIATGLMKGRGAKTLHIWSGIALMGFSVWHYNLYQPSHRDKDK